MDFNTLKDKLKSSHKLITYAAIAFGCVILLLIINTSDDDKPHNYEDILYPDFEYKKIIEDELEEIISNISGVSKATVMVTVEGTYRYKYAKDITDSDIETVLIGNNNALVEMIYNPQISGVLVVCDGGENVKIKEQIINAVSTVLDIPKNKVYVVKLNN